MSLTVLLPVDHRERPLLPLAAGVADLEGLRLGVVDNGLWRSMPVVVDSFARQLLGSGRVGEVTPFDHLARDFPDHQRRLGEFATRQRAVIVGLGN
jgi:hypothetical protein